MQALYIAREVSIFFFNSVALLAVSRTSWNSKENIYNNELTTQEPWKLCQNQLSSSVANIGPVATYPEAKFMAKLFLTACYCLHRVFKLWKNLNCFFLSDYGMCHMYQLLIMRVDYFILHWWNDKVTGQWNLSQLKFQSLLENVVTIKELL